MKHNLFKQFLFAILFLSLTVGTHFSVAPALASCGGNSNVATETELNAAIANFNSQTSACVYTVTLTANIGLTASTSAINNATPNVELLIKGAGFTVDGQNMNGVRPFEIAPDTTVEIQNLTITRSRNNYDGKGIYNNGGLLTLTAVTLTDNASINFVGWGGGLYNNGGTVTIQNGSVISANKGEFSGGIHNTNQGTLNVYDTTISGNRSLLGGGIYNESGTLTVANSTFTDNDGSGSGADIANDDAATISDTQFIGVRQLSGPPIENGQTLTLLRSTISGYDTSSAGTVFVNGTLNVINSTIDNNTASHGGGIVVLGFGTVNVINSTISGNTTEDREVEAGIHMHAGEVNIINSTISGHRRGLQLEESTAVVNLSNSLIVNSIEENCDVAGTINVSGTNFADDDSCTGLTNDSATGIHLGALQDNGGPTFTHALLAGNPAINAGSNAAAVDGMGTPLTTDQRGAGFPRVVGGLVDVGAFESDFLPPDETPPTITPNVSGTLGDNGWYVSDVVVSWTVHDDETAVTTTNGCGPTTIDSDTMSITLTCEATSEGGTDSASVTIKRDATRPTVTATASPTANGNGWHNSDVTVSLSGSDNLSGMASCDGDLQITAQGTNLPASGMCTDNAGNVGSAMLSLNIDKTAPVINVSGVADGETYLLSALPVAACETTDDLSGVDIPATVVISGGDAAGVGTITATCNGGIDMAGNAAPANSVTYTVINPANCDLASGFNLIEGTAGNDRLVGTPENDIIIGYGGHDRIEGLGGNDCLIGGEGSDRIYGGEGDDIIWGGEENNSVVYERSDRDRLYGEEGDDEIHGGGDHDHLEGDEGDDALYGDDGNDGLHGDEGNDDMFGGPGRDRMEGRDGDDLMVGGPDDDTLNGRDGNDEMYGDGGRDRLNGGDGDDEMYGGSEDDRLEGEDGNDSLFGNEGRDSLKGHDGDDHIEGGSEDDDINGGHDNDEIYGDGGNDRIQAERGDDLVFGGSGDDILDGHDGDDQLYGDGGDDELKGGKGDDLLDGGANVDELDGGHDDDTCLNGEDLRSCELP
ncbi:MAG: choice-of-anchor Q domain-containing protein [Chloroflexota bacterium]